MSKTNSNSITSILVAALNEKDSCFRKNMFSLFQSEIKKKKKENKKIKYSNITFNKKIKFYDCTYSPLLYPEMEKKKIDIIARVPGKHKPAIMIEVKANISETLQDSQATGAAYENTSKEYNIPLIYIIPKDYKHRNYIPETATIINWEIIKEKTENIQISFDNQIDNFVEISSLNEKLTEEETNLLRKKDILLRIFNLKETIKNTIDNALKNKRKVTLSQDDQWCVGYYYKYNKNDFYIGFNPEIKNNNFIALAVAETLKINKSQIKISQKQKLDFYEGWYFIPIFSEYKEFDEILLENVRHKLGQSNIFSNSINDDIKNNFKTFQSLHVKIKNFDNIFKEENGHYILNEKDYNDLIKKYRKR